MEPNSGRILAAELVGTAVLVMGGPGSAILAPRPRACSAWRSRSASRSW